MAAMREYDVGDVVRIGNHTATAAELALGITVTREPFRNAAYEPADPEEVTIRLRRPDGTVTVYRWPTPTGAELPLIKEAAQTGRFYADVTADQDGHWRHTERGLNSIPAASSGEFFVRSAV